MFSKAIWTIKDVLFVTIIIFLGSIFISPPLHGIIYRVLRSQGVGLDIFIFVGSIFMIFVPILWVKTKYGIGKSNLGIRKGRWSTILMILIGFGTGVTYFVFESIISGRNLLASKFLRGDAFAFFASWFIIRVFGTSVLSSIGQEVYFRGFVYGYLRGKIGIILGLLVQALIFSLFHLDFLLISTVSLFFILLFERILGGILLGILYEISDSIYPCIVCHVTFNFLIKV